jgi:predicted GNAT family acetyltransferase
MYYKIHSDRIVLEDEDGTRIAEIDYPAAGEGIREITHIYGSDSPEGIRHARNLMDLAVRELRKNGQKAVATNAFAASWFRDHPEAQDILVTAAGQAGSEKGSSGYDTRAADMDRTAPLYQEVRREAVPYRTSAKNRVKKKEAAAPLSKASRILQLISALVMLAVLLLNFTSVYQNGGLTGGPSLASEASTGFFSLAVLFLAWTLIQLIWILTRKAYRTAGRVIRLDPGRGLCGFLVVLIVSCVCKSITYFVPTAAGIFAGIIRYSEVFNQSGTVITLLAILGIALCIVRKVIRR